MFFEVSRVDLRVAHCLYYSKKVTEMGVQKFSTSKGDPFRPVLCKAVGVREMIPRKASPTPEVFADYGQEVNDD